MNENPKIKDTLKELILSLDSLAYADAKEVILGTFNRAYIEIAIEKGGNVSRGARFANLDRSNFKRIMKKNGYPPHKENQSILSPVPPPTSGTNTENDKPGEPI